MKCEWMGAYYLDAKLTVASKHIMFGAATLAWQDYFQMALTASRTAVEELCLMVSTNEIV